MMRFLLAVMAGLLAAPGVGAQTPLSKEFDRIGAKVALLVTSSSLSENPLWSPDSKRLGFNTERTWEQIDLSILRLQPGEWHGMDIATIRWRGGAEALESTDLPDWKKATRSGAQEVKDRAGNVWKMVAGGMASALTLTAPGRETVTLWRVQGQRCGKLSISPDDQWLAFQCDDDGILVTELGRYTKNLK